MSATWFGGAERRGGGRGENPETPITRAIRDMLDLLRIPHFKHASGQFSAKGVPDIIGTIAGRVLPAITNEADAWALAKSIKGSETSDPAEATIILARRVVELEARGSAMWCEVKVPGKGPRPEQEDFLARHKAAGGLAFVAHDAREVVAALSAFGYQPAQRMAVSLGQGKPS